jgi:hypothetical protein
MPNYDLTNLALEIAAPANQLLYDDLGDPSVMVKIPKFKISDVIAGGSNSTHPAFIINGVERDAIYISKYQNVVNNGRAYSLPMQDPAASLNFDQAWGYCKAKGPGWHLMTNAEFAAIALWCKANGFQPKGNNSYGKDVADTALPQKALPSMALDGSGRIQRVATGSGPLSWYHDNTAAGIADLNGNVWEWNAGMRLNAGEIQVLANNDAADWNNPVTAASALWKAILAADGSLVAPGTAGTLKYDYLNSKITLTANAVTDVSGTSRNTNYGLLGKDASVTTVPEIASALGLFPNDTTAANYTSDNVWATMAGERLPLRGGPWNFGASAGVFALALGGVRTNVSTDVGFRAAFVEL